MASGRAKPIMCGRRIEEAEADRDVFDNDNNNVMLY